MLVTDFRALAPAHAIAQARSLAWLADAHTRAERTRARRDGGPFDEARFRAHIARRLERFGCGEDKIGNRGHEIADCAHDRWSEMGVYRLDERPEGEGMLVRTRAFADVAGGALARLYAEREVPPADLVHVTCTGYVSPSAAQRLVASKGWGEQTRVTHAYHMGCYAALTALRIASGLASAEEALRPPAPRRADVVHTEVCSLHLNPLLHDPEQLVVQTLFADGFISYALCDESAWDARAPAMRLLALAETIVPDSSDAMTWICSDWGMQMSLARDVPDRLAGALRGFVARLLARAGVGDDERAGLLYAIHPGGPRILDRVREGLELDEAQIAFSRTVLRTRGNMSSATLPHVWMDIARARDVREGRAVVSLAFGPGLTLCGAVMRKVTR